MVKRTIGIVVVLAVVLGVVRLVAVWPRDRDDAVRVVTGATVDYILVPTDMTAFSSRPDSAFDVGDDNTVILTSGGSLVGVQRSGEGVNAERLAENAPRSYAIDADGNLLGIDRGYFGEYENGQFSLAVPIPVDGLRMAGSHNAGAVYLFGGSGESSNRVYTFYRDGLLDVLSEVPAPVVGVADSAAAVYVATEREIYRVAPQAQNLAFRIADDAPPIRSIAACDDRIVYFSTDARVYAVQGLAAIAVVPDMGGIVRCRNGSLYVWNRERGVLARITGVPSALGSQ
jgi:hypothetical protein